MIGLHKDLSWIAFLDTRADIPLEFRAGRGAKLLKLKSDLETCTLNSQEEGHKVPEQNINDVAVEHMKGFFINEAKEVAQ